MKREGDYYENEMVCGGGQAYPYLFWEGKDRIGCDMTKGFVVPGSETKSFLREKLEFLGPKWKKREELIQYWLPGVKGSPYSLITFQKEAYKGTARLRISPEPDSILRVFMVYTPLAQPVQVEKPELNAFKRKGFTAVERGGKEILVE